ncbi:MAG: hypothetical protein Q9218_005923 [Villophora microphyllina]
MVIVGGVDTDGTLWKRSRVDPDEHQETIKLHAPAVEITVPSARGDWRPPAEIQGVSYAASTVAGLAAYYLGLSSFSDVIRDDDPVQRVRKLKNVLELGTSVKRTDNVRSLYNLADPRTCPPDVPSGFQDGDEVPCRDTSSTSGNTVLAIPNCFITTITPTASQRAGETIPPSCSCAGAGIAGVASGIVSGTTYSWCQTVGSLPSGVPPEATADPVAIEHPDSAPPPPTPPAIVPQATPCVVKGKASDTATCTSSFKQGGPATSLPDGVYTCISRKLGEVCLCQTDGTSKECQKMD